MQQMMPFIAAIATMSMNYEHFFVRVFISVSVALEYVYETASNSLGVLHYRFRIGYDATQ